MITLLLLLGAGSAFGGVSIQMPYLNPAGVTYSHVPAAFPVAPSPLQYSVGTTSSVAYGNAAFIGRHLAPAAFPYSAAPVAHVAAPLAHVAAPVAHVAAPVAPVVPTVHHVPAIAQVPVTKYHAQPAVIQNVVDVAKQKIATRKIEIRRPAIQKEFYDVEERVVIRPAGSAVVELDQPVSKSQKGETLVHPAVHALPVAPVVGVRAFHHHVYPAAYPAAVAVHPYPIHEPSAPVPTPVSPPPQENEPQPTEAPDNFDNIPQEPIQPNPPQVSQDAGFSQQEAQQFDDSDSVAVDNPEIARSREQQSDQIPRSFLRNSSPDITPEVAQPLFRLPQQPLFARFQALTQQRAASQQQFFAMSQVQAQEQIVAQLQAQTEAQQAQLQRSQQILQIQQEELQRSRQAYESFTRNTQQQPQEEQQQPAARKSDEPKQEEGLPSVQPDPQPTERKPAPVVETSNLRDAILTNTARSSAPATSRSVIPSVRLSPEQSLSNQERLIALLTARGGIVEARNSVPSAESHQVRARVLSVTPAPEGASPTDEKVNTRRIVVSRPIQTVEEVDVVQPFTKIERVAVHSPAVIKSASVGVAHVPTSLPVHGYAHAVPAAIPAY